VKRQNKLYRITLAAMFAALIFTATAFLMIPLPGGGYAHLGDCFIVVSALTLGPIYGAAAAGIGSAISDLFLGFAVYAPATFVIKGAMGIAIACVYWAMKKTTFRYEFLRVVTAALVAELIMVLGYFVFECALWGVEVAVVDVLGNAIQGLAGLVSGTLLFGALKQTGLIGK
jgi:uncharacterized membrane protein